MATTLNDIFALVQAMKDADEEVTSAELVLSSKKEAFRYLQEEAIPTAMQEIGLLEATLDTGEKLKIKQDVYASISAANKEAAFQWLEDNDFGGLIKVDVEVNYGKGEAEQAVELMELLKSQGLSVSVNQGVNAMTLKAFLREQIAKGNPNLPMEVFSCRPVWQAKISKK